jgi:hypothetical protein
VENGVDAVFDAGAVGREHGAFGGALAHEAGFVVEDPDVGEVAGADELGESEGVDFIGLILAQAMALVRRGLETTSL